MASDRVIVVSYDDLASSSTDLSTQLERAFGSSTVHNLGLIAIRGVPGFVDAKRRFLPLAHGLAHLDPEYLEESLTDERSFYNAGWSRGKEKLGDEPDFSKGSYYFNPITDRPGSDKERETYPASFPCNIWPDEAANRQLNGFRESARELGRIMHDAVTLLARHIDSMAKSKVSGYSDGSLFEAMKTTEKTKGRLLYYYPLEDDSEVTGSAAPKEDSWIGWHNDSGFLTALSGDMYVNDETGEPLDRSEVDPEAGLYVAEHGTGAPVRVEVPEDCLAIQAGECLQILTGGVVAATPHCVRGPRPDWEGRRRSEDSSGAGRVKVARISCPCFVDSGPTFPLSMPEGCSKEDVLGAGAGGGRVPPLGRRWTENGQSFGNFLQRSFEVYYDWSR